MVLLLSTLPVTKLTANAEGNVFSGTLSVTVDTTAEITTISDGTNTLGKDDYIKAGTTLEVNKNIRTGGIIYYADVETCNKEIDNSTYWEDSSERLEYVTLTRATSSATIDASYLNGKDGYQIIKLDNTGLIQTNGMLWIFLVPANFSGDNSSSNGQSSSRSASTSGHTHTYDWITLKEPTATEDGFEAYRCTECGYTPEGYGGQIRIAAYPYFVKSALRQIEKAPLNSTVQIKSDIFGSVPVTVMQAIAQRPDLTVDFSLTHKHEKYDIEIPAGTAINTDFDYYGSLKLVELYGRK